MFIDVFLVHRQFCCFTRIFLFSTWFTC